MKTKTSYILGQSYIFVFVGDGVVKMFETEYTTKKGELYGYFDCGIEVRLDGSLDVEWMKFFNITDSRLNDYINCSLYIFSTREKAKEVLPKIIKGNLTEMKSKAEVLMKEYMKIADDCTTIENAFKSIKKGTFEITNPFEK